MSPEQLEPKQPNEIKKDFSLLSDEELEELLDKVTGFRHAMIYEKYSRAIRRENEETPDTLEQV